MKSVVVLIMALVASPALAQTDDEINKAYADCEQPIRACYLSRNPQGPECRSTTAQACFAIEEERKRRNTGRLASEQKQKNAEIEALADRIKKGLK